MLAFRQADPELETPPPAPPSQLRAVPPAQVPAPVSSARPRRPVTLLDSYVAGQLIGTFFAILAIVFAVMLLEHVPKLFEMVRFSGEKTYVVTLTVLSLVPEYAAIGSLFGLYFAVGLTVRRLSLRGELDAIEANGISPRRWMRMPIIGALAVAMLLFGLQGWLKPWGEANIARIERELADGVFGLSLKSGEFVDFGGGSTLHFDAIDGVKGKLEGIFLHLPGKTITARDGTAHIGAGGKVSLTLTDGQIVSRDAQGQLRSLAFDDLRESDIARRPKYDPPTADAALKQRTLPELMRGAVSESGGALGGRMLWPLFALLAPLLGFVLGKPPRRGEGFVGLLAGGVLIVLFLRLAIFVREEGAANPALFAGGAALACCLAAALLLIGEQRFGRGFIDAWLVQIYHAARNAWRRIAGLVRRGNGKNGAEETANIYHIRN